MSPKWMIALVSSFVALVFIAALVERTYATTGATNYLETLVVFPHFFNPSSIIDYFTALWGAVSFNYPSLFSGSWVYVRYGLMSFGIGVGVSLVITLSGFLIRLASGLTSIIRR